jgi:hypothetical protein
MISRDNYTNNSHHKEVWGSNGRIDWVHLRHHNQRCVVRQFLTASIRMDFEVSEQRFLFCRRAWRLGGYGVWSMRLVQQL